MKKIFIFFMCIVTQFYCIYGESYSEIINKAKTRKFNYTQFYDFDNEYDFLVHKYDESKKINYNKKKMNELFINTFMKIIPFRKIKMLRTEVTQELYKAVMGNNPSRFVGDQLPVERVSWYDAIYFCNSLSEIFLLTPVYSVNGETDVTQWKYVPHKGNVLEGKIEQNLKANGYRLPTVEEWQYAARGGQNFNYAGSNYRDEVAWNSDNSNHETHAVGNKKSNGYGLYDMSGNVGEWCWDSNNNYYYNYRYNCGGSWNMRADDCLVAFPDDEHAEYQVNYIGFRIVCSAE